jgi:ribosome-associated protein
MIIIGRHNYTKRAAMPESEKQLPDEFSKTQRKKDLHKIRDLGEQLAELADSQLAKLPISPEIHDLIKAARTIKSREAKRRHMQYLGKKMRDEDIEAIQLAMKKNRF